jgi:hypothetical protein
METVKTPALLSRLLDHSDINNPNQRNPVMRFEPINYEQAQ